MTCLCAGIGRERFLFEKNDWCTGVWRVSRMKNVFEFFIYFVFMKAFERVKYEN